MQNHEPQKGLDQYESIDFTSALSELSKIRDEVEDIKEWFRKHSLRPMLLFRIVGLLIIIMSISLPFLSSQKGWILTTVLPLVSLMIATLAAINSFFQWQTVWQVHRQTQYSLEYLLRRWSLEITEAKCKSDRGEAVRFAIEATRRLLKEAQTVSSSASTEFFESLELPQSLAEIKNR